MSVKMFWSKVESGEIYPDGWFRLGQTEAYTNGVGESFGHRFSDDTVFAIVNGNIVELL